MCWWCWTRPTSSTPKAATCRMAWIFSRHTRTCWCRAPSPRLTAWRRCGLSTAVVADVLNRVRQPFNVNSLALAAACAAVKDAEYLEEGRRINESGMLQLQEGFRELGLGWIPSKGNFICVDLAQVAAPVFQGLLREGVIVRPVANYGMPNHLRITIGLPAENSRFLEALTKVLARG